MKELRFYGRKAVVTGSARGIGLAITRRLLEEGATVAAVDADTEVLETAARQLTSEGFSRLLQFPCDIADVAGIAELAARVQENFGGIDFLINNAAILDWTPIDSLTDAVLEHVLRVNFGGAVNCVRALLPQLSKSPSARIVNIASINGLRGTSNSIAYNAAKAALVNLTRCLAVDLSPRGIVVNAIAPGFIETRMSKLPDGSSEYETDSFRDVFIKHRRIPAGRVGQPEDIAGPVAFLCSADAAYISGHVLVVDGGVTATF